MAQVRTTYPDNMAGCGKKHLTFGKIKRDIRMQHFYIPPHKWIASLKLLKISDANKDRTLQQMISMVRSQLAVKALKNKAQLWLDHLGSQLFLQKFKDQRWIEKNVGPLPNYLKRKKRMTSEQDSSWDNEHIHLHTNPVLMSGLTNLPDGHSMAAPPFHWFDPSPMGTETKLQVWDEPRMEEGFLGPSALESSHLSPHRLYHPETSAPAHMAPETAVDRTDRGNDRKGADMADDRKKHFLSYGQIKRDIRTKRFFTPPHYWIKNLMLLKITEAEKEQCLQQMIQMVRSQLAVKPKKKSAHLWLQHLASELFSRKLKDQRWIEENVSSLSNYVNRKKRMTSEQDSSWDNEHIHLHTNPVMSGPTNLPDGHSMAAPSFHWFDPSAMGTETKLQVWDEPRMEEGFFRPSALESSHLSPHRLRHPETFAPAHMAPETAVDGTGRGNETFERNGTMSTIGWHDSESFPRRDYPDGLGHTSSHSRATDDWLDGNPHMTHNCSRWEPDTEMPDPLTHSPPSVTVTSSEFNCMVPGCAGGVPLKDHAFQVHIPGVFQEQLKLDEPVLNMRYQALRYAASCMFRRPATLDELQRVLKLLAPLPAADNDLITQYHNHAMSSFARYLRRPIPEQFQLSPINSEAALMHWKVLLLLAARMDGDQLEHWRQSYGVPPSSQVLQEPSSCLPRAFDAYFNLERTNIVAKLHLKSSLDELLQFADKKLRVETGRQVQLIGTCVTYCNPERYPTFEDLWNLPDSNVVSIGFPPRYASQEASVMQTTVKHMKALLESPRVTAFGEIGLDHALPEEHWPSQRRLLRSLLPLIKPYHVLILRCRSEGKYVALEFMELLSLLVQGKLPSCQKILLHSFTGDEYVVKKWLEAFPNTYFGYSNVVKRFQSSQIEALRSLDPSSIVLETNGPNFPVHGRRWSVPSQLHYVAEIVAKPLGETPEDLLERTTENAIRLFQC